MGEHIVLVYLVVCLFVFLAGFVDSIAGGGGLISLPAYMIAGLPAHTAIATNKISSAMGTTVSTFYYLRQGFMKWKNLRTGHCSCNRGLFTGCEDYSDDR